MELNELKEMTDISEACVRFSEILGSSKPVPDGVLYAALEDEDYARNLLLARRSPELMNMLFAQRTQYSPKTVVPQEEKQSGYTNLQLLEKLGKSMWKWGLVGFSTVTEEVYNKRLAACASCDQLEEAPDRLVYKISLKKNEDKRTCKTCGCVVARKARLTNDTCPREDTGNPGFNRWGE
ncbi:hypothetical protein [Chryseobacterium sp. MYb328]|uniref:hypothetical protein n=1 Tax=Chryseobacterium sp. MYb328 TaxID=2745231 RepID=UPI003096D665